MKKIDIKEVAKAALGQIENLVAEWLPHGKRESKEWSSVNPTRADSEAGSFKVNLTNGRWADFATDDAGGDLVSLYAYLFGSVSQLEAAKALANRLGVGEGDAAPVSPAALAKVKKVEEAEALSINVQPVPSDAPMRPISHWHRGHPAMTSLYKDVDGNLLGAVLRFVRSNGGKEDLPLTLWQDKITGQMSWEWRQFPVPRPLYGLDGLKNHPYYPVLIVEGEKCVNVAAEVLAGHFVVMSWSGGSNAVEKADWTTIQNRNVYLWPDADCQREKLSKEEKEAGIDPESKPYLDASMQAGQKAMNAIAEKLAKQGCRVSMFQLPPVGDLPSGFDIADYIEAAKKEGQDDVQIADALYEVIAASPLLDFSNDDEEKIIEEIPVIPEWLDVDESICLNEPEEVANGFINDDVGDGDDVDNLPEILQNYALVEGKTKVIHVKNGIEFSKSALIAKYNKKDVEKWFEHPRKMIYTPVEVKRLKNQAERLLQSEQKEVMNAIERYVFLDGSTSIWDKQLGRMIEQGAAKLAMGSYFDDWRDAIGRQVIPFENVVFEPGLDMGDGYINLFNGLPLEYTGADRTQLPKNWRELAKTMPEIKPIIDLIWHLVDADSVVMEWLLNWIAYPLQNVGAKMGTAILMHSDVHGSGKSLLWEEVVKPLYGQYAATVGQTAMESQYTGNRSGKLFMLFEEIFSNKQKYDHGGSLKQMITGKTQQIEKKFIDAYEEANHMNCVFLSNHIQPFLVEEYDRRFLVIWPEKTADEDFYNRVLTCTANGGLQAFYNFLMALPLTVTVDGKEKRFDAHTKPPMTAAKERVIEWGLSGWQLFHKQWQRNDFDVPYVSCFVDDLWAVFEIWCRKNNERILPRNKFVIAISTKIPKARRWWRNQHDQTKHQAQIFKVGRESEGEMEQDYLGKTVLKFQAALNRYKGTEVE